CRRQARNRRPARNHARSPGGGLRLDRTRGPDPWSVAVADLSCSPVLGEAIEADRRAPRGGGLPVELLRRRREAVNARAAHPPRAARALRRLRSPPVTDRDSGGGRRSSRCLWAPAVD